MDLLHRAKNFYLWHTKKRIIHNETNRVFCKEREIWFCYLGENIGFEQDGRGVDFLRPVVVVKKFNNEIFWAIPLTKGEKPKRSYYYTFQFVETVCSTAIISQLRLVDVKRLKYKTGTMTEVDFECLKIKIRQLLA